MNDKITWVMVPKDLDAFMMYAACEAAPKLSLVSIKNVYQAILAAAPTPPVQEDQLDAAAAEIARLRSESATQSERLDALKAEKDELQALCDKLAGLLSRTAVALRGPEPPLTRWSWHDLPERAQAAIAAIDLMGRVAKNLAQDAPTPPAQDALSTDPASRLIDDVMQLNADLHASNEALMCDVLDMRAVMQRMVAGITHLAEIARQWEPDHSSGADRRGWLLAREAADDAKALLDAQAKRLLTPKSQEASK